MDQELTEAPLNFRRCASASLALCDYTVADLLQEADMVANLPPSKDWIPVFAKMVDACCRRVPRWMYLSDRLQYFADRIPEYIVQSGCHNECLLAFKHMFISFLGERPVPQEVSERMFGGGGLGSVTDRDELLSIALEVESSVARHVGCEMVIEKLYHVWINRFVTTAWSISMLLSIVNYTLLVGGRPKIYERRDFETAATDEAIKKLHLQGGWNDLETLLSQKGREFVASIIIQDDTPLRDNT
ncbi:MAG: hypothetical protein WCH39_09665 [Schlesneria sp.]